MLNKVALVGRLTRDPEVRQAGTGQVTRFTVAVERNFKSKSGEKETDFIPIVTFGKTAELCAQYLAKGHLVSLSGRIQTGSYDGSDGTKRYTTDVIADEVGFLTSRAEAQAMAQGPRQQPTSYRPQQQQPSTSPPYESYGVPMESFEEIDDLDVPF